MRQAVVDVTGRIRERSAAIAARLPGADRGDARPAARRRPPRLRQRGARLRGAAARNDKFSVVAERAPNIGIVTAYNDMLSAHQPYERFPAVIKDEARKHGATAQVAGGVPAMCDGVTQGTPGMELSLFSRDTIAMGTADRALARRVRRRAAARHLRQDRAGPADRRAALRPPAERVRARRADAQRPVQQPRRPRCASRPRKAWSVATSCSRPKRRRTTAPGTCTFYGTANSNQMLMEAMGLHVPGAAFVHPQRRPARGAHARGGAHACSAIARRRARFTPIGRLVDERAIVNAMVALLATGGSTNHLIHWVAVARSAGIVIDWNDFAELSRVDAAAGARLSERQRRREPVPGRGRPGLRASASCSTPAACTTTSLTVRRRRHARLHARARRGDGGGSRWRDAAGRSGDDGIVRRARRAVQRRPAA